MSSGHKRRRGPEHPYLAGNFAPVAKTHASTPCTYTGTIPTELLGGQYVRNGANPVSNAHLGRDAHWFDGDGMLAGVLFERSHPNPNQAVPHFVNQYILTDVCISSFENTSLRTPILPSISTLVNPLSSLIVVIFRIFRAVFLVLLSHLPASQQAIKRISVANTAIYFHDGRALATCESGPPIRVQLPSLETLGWFDGSQVEEESQPTEAKEVGFGGTGLLSFMREWATGHPKVDPQTGEMVLFHCNFSPPYVHYSVIPPEKSGSFKPAGRKILSAPVPGCSGGKMMHDFGVSFNHTVILDLPLSLTPLNLLKNKPVVCYEPNKPARFGVFPRSDPAKVRWFETKGCCIFHTANTWDECDQNGNHIAVNMLACRFTSASQVFSAANLTPPPHPDNKRTVRNRPISFFAKYGDDGDTADLEKVGSNEESPLLPSENVTVQASSASIPPISEDEEQCRLYYYRFSLADCDSQVTHQYALSTIPIEFPTANPAYEMSRARYIYGCSTSNESFGAALGKATKIDILLKMDVQTLLARGEMERPETVTGSVDRRTIGQVLASGDDEDPIRAFKMPPNCYAQEARFVSSTNPVSEDDGYLLFYVFDESQLDGYGECLPDAASELWILYAKNMTDVIGKVRLPQRVPYGLHGNWFTETQIEGQRAVDRVRTLPVEATSTRVAKMKSALIRALR